MKKANRNRLFNRATSASLVTLMLMPMALAAPTAVPRYQIVDIGTLGGNESGGLDINDAGIVTGSSQTADGLSHAFLFENDQLIDLGTLGGTEATGSSDGVDINNSGQITGTSSTANGERHAFLYSDGVMSDLGVSGGTYSNGHAINEAGEVTGIVEIPDLSFNYHAFLYTTDAGMTDIGTLGDSYSTGDDINETGAVVGIYQNQYESHAYLYSQGSLIDLFPGVPSYIAAFGQSLNAAGHVTGTYQGPDSQRSFIFRDSNSIDIGTLGGSYAAASAINAVSQITGVSGTTNGEDHAFLYSAGAMEDLGTLGGNYSVGNAINDSGYVTGQSVTASGEYHPFVYANGTMTDLGLPPGGMNGFGQAINAAGQVTGIYQVESGDEFEPFYLRGFLATPIALLFTRLQGRVAGISPGNILEQTVYWALRSYEVPDSRTSCAMLSVFEYEVNWLSYFKKNIRGMAKALVTDAGSIRNALGCGSQRVRSDDRPSHQIDATALVAADKAFPSSAKERALKAYKERFERGLNTAGADNCAKASTQLLRSLTCRSIPALRAAPKIR